MLRPTPAQARAADPGRSAWVTANAGSGKTRVLTDRVARLLLAGTDPARILCLTFTKAAAAEMQARLFQTLGRWVMQADDALASTLALLGHDRAAGAEDLARARRLFARALETPGGLRIQTIHAFCTDILHRFPLEAGIAPRFAVLDDAETAQLLDGALTRIAEAEPALLAAMAALDSRDPRERLLPQIAAEPAFRNPPDRQALERLLGVGADDSLEALAETLIRRQENLLGEAAALLGTGKATDTRVAARLRAAMAAAQPARALAELEAGLLFGGTAKHPFAPKTPPMTKALADAHPEMAARLSTLARAVAEGRATRLALAARDRNLAFMRFGHALAREFDRQKDAIGALDFDDLVVRTTTLLTQSDQRGWVLWRLDGSLDHVLVDEAQDTAPAQWRVLGALTEEFFAGAGARPGPRTLFVVGDEKQSIYSFMGADPDAFRDERARYVRLFEAAGARLEGVDLVQSFRSAPPILALVDTVAAADGLGPDIRHEASDPDRPGRVECWDYLATPSRDPSPDWDNLDPSPARADVVADLARRIAARLAAIIGQPLPGTGQVVRPGDVMILTARRKAMFHAVIGALKAAGIPVAGADRMILQDLLAAQDLLACLRVTATPADDLSLAAVLKSPLGGFTEAALFDLAHGRPGTLAEALTARYPDHPVTAMLADLQARADFLRPFELIQRILIRHDGRRLLTGRLGAEAIDGIDALLDQALAFETRATPELTGFLAWIDRAAIQVERRPDEAGDRVRVMTIHGAKGLEAPVVILPETDPRKLPSDPVLLVDGLPLWRGDRASHTPAVAAAIAEEEARVRAEDARQLYVAITRAQRWLIVAGAGSPDQYETSWHGRISAAMDALAARRADLPGAAGSDGIGMRILSHRWQTDELPPPPVPQRPEPAPRWAYRPPPPPAVPAPPRPRPASGLGGAHALPDPTADPAAEASALAHGRAVHALLETLPALPRAAWDSRLPGLLAGAPDPEAARQEALAVLEDPALAHLFAADALAEAAIAADLPGLGRVTGRIDRLLATGPGLVAVDFKTNRLVPDTADAVPEAILRQLGAYRAALLAACPGRRVTMHLLWTRSRALMAVPEPLLTAALERAALDPSTGAA